MKKPERYVRGADKTVSTRLPASTVEALDQLAAEMGISRYEIIRQMIEATLIHGEHRAPALDRVKYSRGRPDKKALRALMEALEACGGPDPTK